MSKATFSRLFGRCDEGLKMLFKAELLTIGDDRRSALMGVSVAIRAKELRVMPAWRVLGGGW